MSSPAERQMDPPESARIRWRLWVFVGLAIAIFLIFILWRVSLSSHATAKLNALQKAGYATSMAELQQKYYAPIADEKNAALYFLDAFPNMHETRVKALDHLWGGRLSMQAALADRTNRQQFTEALRTNNDLLDQLRQVPEGLSSRYPLDFSQGFNILLPHLGRIKDAEKMLMLDAVMSVEAKNSAQTMEDFRASIRLAKSLDDEPLLISQLVRIACHAIILSSLEHALTSGSFTDAQLKELADALAHEENSKTMERAFDGELCCGVFAFQMVTDMNQASQNNGTDAKSMLAGRAMNAAGITAHDFNGYLDAMKQYLAVCKIGFPDNLDAAKNVDKKTLHDAGPFHPISDLMLTGLSKQVEKTASDAARLNIMQTALAIERYRLAHENRLPDKLEDFTPTFLAAVPTDPFDGRPLRYQKLQKGYRVYSIGTDRKDDGGKEPNPKDRQAPSDITFTVER